jgi:hypothetical protein
LSILLLRTIYQHIDMEQKNRKKFKKALAKKSRSYSLDLVSGTCRLRAELWKGLRIFLGLPV